MDERLVFMIRQQFVCRIQHDYKYDIKISDKQLFSIQLSVHQQSLFDGCAIYLLSDYAAHGSFKLSV